MMMDERSSRIFFGLCMLVVVWIGVYWMWQPDKDPDISFEQPPPAPITLQPAQQTPSPEQPIPDRSPSTIIDQFTGESPSRPQTAAAREPDRPRLLPPEFTEHIVQSGERMQTIAQTYYGSINDWAVIARANPRVDPTKLREGMVLRIPTDKANIQGRVEGETSQPGVITSRTPTESRVIEYVVRPGDSLSVISQRIYGSSRHARFIFESNRDILSSMDAIAVGQLLKLPPLPEPEQPSSPGDQ